MSLIYPDIISYILKNASDSTNDSLSFLCRFPSSHPKKKTSRASAPSAPWAPWARPGPDVRSQQFHLPTDC